MDDVNEFTTLSHTLCDRYYYLMRENDRIGKKWTETKYRWEKIDVIPLLTLVGLNHHQPIIQMSKEWYIFIQQMNKWINLKMFIWLTIHFKLIGCSENKLKNA